MKKKILFLSILCLLFVTLSYTYSSFNNTIVGTITANVKDWVFKVSVDNGTIKDGGYNLHLSGTSGSFNVNINTTGSKNDADYTIELIGNNKIKFYTNSGFTDLIKNNIYNGTIIDPSNNILTIYYQADSNIDSDIFIKFKGNKAKKSYIYNFGTRSNFAHSNYKSYIRSITFDKGLDNLPSSCTATNLCWDITSEGSNKTYSYLIDSGLKYNDNILYNLYIVSNSVISAPTDCTQLFQSYWNLVEINFNNFDTSNVTNMNTMFFECSKLTSLDLSSFNTSNVKYMESMFYDCSSLKNLNLGGFNTTNVINLSYLFNGISSVTTTINIMNNNISYDYMFKNAATSSDSQITVNYIASASDLVDKIIATKSENSNVVKGNVINEHSITISGNNDIKYVSNNKLKGTKVSLQSISGNTFVTSFKVNGERFNGYEFIMPDNDVIITDIVSKPYEVVETKHYPYPANLDNSIVGEHTFDGAKSLTVILDYQTENISWDYFLIYDSNTSTTGINNNKKYGGSTRTQEIITINSNYIKIAFTTNEMDYHYNTYYGIKAIIIPNY